MKANSSSRRKPLYKRNIFDQNFDRKVINRIAHSSGFVGRSDGKIDARSLIVSFMQMLSKGLKSYSALASEISVTKGITLSKQAVEERMNVKTSQMIKEVYQANFEKMAKENPTRLLKGLKAKFGGAIYTEDCTHGNLPEELAHHYPGNVSRGKVKSQFKLHALYNLTNNRFGFIGLNSFRDNDQSLAMKALDHLKKGDLLLRDLGFFVSSALRLLDKQGVYFVTRMRSDINLFEPKSQQKFNLIKRLRKNSYYDGVILVGNKHKIPLRLTVLPLSSEHASERRRKAKQNRDRRLNHSPQYYKLLGYRILLTNIPYEKCSAQEIAQLYGLRWRIEIIFKSWKSCLSLEKIIPNKCKNIHRINCIIYFMLLYILLFQTFWLRCCQYKKGNFNRYFHLSLLKIAAFFNQHFQSIINNTNSQAVIWKIAQTCTHEVRHDRKNTMEIYRKLAA